MKLFFIFLLIGFLINHIFPFISTYINFTTLAVILLVIGLYASVYEIDNKIIKKHTKMVITAVTFGVLVKSIIIGTIFFLITKNSFSFLLGVAVAQIDPLSVSYLLKSKDGSFSATGRAILRVWASFDDPMTILLSVFFVAPLTIGTFHNNPFVYLYEFVFNTAFALIIFILDKYILNEIGKKIILVLSLVIAGVFNLTLGIALIALFLRPKLGDELSKIVTAAFFIGVLLLGITLKIDIQAIVYGIMLGILAFGAQVVATFLIAKKLKNSDKLHLAFAQYNGITSIGLAIFFAQYFHLMTSIIAVAVITINTIYYVTNHILYKRLFIVFVS